MKINRAFKTELDLNNVQRTTCAQHAGAARYAYNWGLARKIEVHQAGGKTPMAIDLHKELNRLKQSELAWMYESSKCAPQEALRNLDNAFDHFFRRVQLKKDMIKINKVEHMASKYSVDITTYEYNVLGKNHLISMACKQYLQSAVTHDSEVALILTLTELQDLIGYIAAEANHARSKRNSEDLNMICDYLEAAEEDIKHGMIESFDT